MRLNERRIDQLAERIVDLLLEEDLIDFRPTRKRMVVEVSRFITADLAMEDEITNEAMAKLATYSLEFPEGSTEWMLLLNKHKDEIAARRGYVL